MPDQTESQPELNPGNTPAAAQPAENPPQPLPANDNGTKNVSPENAPSHSIFTAASNAFGKISARIKKGRGRPRLDGQPGKADVIIENSAAENAPPFNQPDLDPENPAPANVIQLPDFLTRANTFLRRVLSTSLKPIIGAWKRRLSVKAEAAGYDRDFIRDAMQQCEVDPVHLAEWSEATELLLEKYKIDTKYAVEAAWLIATGKIAAPLVQLEMLFAAEAARKRKEEKNRAPEQKIAA